MRCFEKLVLLLLTAMLMTGWPPTEKAWTPEGVKDEYRPWKFSGGDNLSYEKQIMGIREERFKLLLNPGSTVVQIFNIQLSAGITSFALTNRSDAAEGEIRLYEMLISYQEESK